MEYKNQYEKNFYNGHLANNPITYDECRRALSDYQAKTRRIPFFISDWDVDDNVLLPDLLLEHTLPRIKQNINKYYLIEDGVGCADTSQYLKKQIGISIPPKQILVGGSATSLLCLLLLSLLVDMEDQALILEPAYFSVHDMFDLFHRQPLTVSVSIPEFTYDYTKIENIIHNEKVKLLIVTDPIFGSGISIGQQGFCQLVELANKYHCVLVVDMARIGMHWDTKKEILLGQQLYWIQKAEQYAVVYAPCKNVFANGIKTGVLISSDSIAVRIGNYSDSFLGSISASQAEFLTTLLSEDSWSYISQQMASNISLAKAHFDILDALLHYSGCKVIKPDMGHYALSICPSTGCTERDIFFKLLREANVYTLPMGLYRLQSRDSYIFRVNLLAEMEALISGMECILATLKSNEQ